MRSIGNVGPGCPIHEKQSSDSLSLFLATFIGSTTSLCDRNIARAQQQGQKKVTSQKLCIESQKLLGKSVALTSTGLIILPYCCVYNVHVQSSTRCLFNPSDRAGTELPVFTTDWTMDERLPAGRGKISGIRESDLKEGGMLILYCTARAHTHKRGLDRVHRVKRRKMNNNKQNNKLVCETFKDTNCNFKCSAVKREGELPTESAAVNTRKARCYRGMFSFYFSSCADVVHKSCKNKPFFSP